MSGIEIDWNCSIPKIGALSLIMDLFINFKKLVINHIGSEVFEHVDMIEMCL